MPPYQVRGRLLESGMTNNRLYKQTLFKFVVPAGAGIQVFPAETLYGTRSVPTRGEGNVEKIDLLRTRGMDTSITGLFEPL